MRYPGAIRVHPFCPTPQAHETAVFAGFEEVARGETLFDTGAERFEERSEENSYAGWRFHCYLRTDSASFLFDRQRIVSLLALRTDSASLRFVASGAFSHDPSDPLPPLSRA